MPNFLRLSLINLAAALLQNTCYADENFTVPIKPVGQAILKAESNRTIPKLNHDDTIAGPDTDNNGIRDDIDAYIATLPYTDVQKKAIEQEARAISASLIVNVSDKNALMNVVNAMSRASSCEFSRFDITTAGNTGMEKMIVNTKPRFIQYEKFNSALSGGVFASPDGDGCDKG
jgi:hypothetical protein